MPKYPLAVLSLGSCIHVDDDKIVDLTGFKPLIDRDVFGDGEIVMEVQSFGSFADKALWINHNYEFTLATDECGGELLIITRR